MSQGFLWHEKPGLPSGICQLYLAQGGTQKPGKYTLLSSPALLASSEVQAIKELFEVTIIWHSMWPLHEI